MVSVQSNLSANDNLYLQPLSSTNITTSAPPPQIIRHWNSGVCDLDPSHMQFTAGFVCLWESNAPTDRWRQSSNPVTRTMGGSYKYRWLAPLPAIHLLLCSPVPIGHGLLYWSHGLGLGTCLRPHTHPSLICHTLPIRATTGSFCWSAFRFQSLVAN